MSLNTIDLPATVNIGVQWRVYGEDIDSNVIQL